MKMAKVINFEKLAIQNIVNKQLGFQQLEFEILLTVIRYVYAFMDKELDDPIEHIHPKCRLDELFEGSRERFAHAFTELMNYWEIDNLSWDEIPIHQEFEKFKTVEDLCLFLESKVIEPKR